MCTQYTGYGEITGNVFHDNAMFGMFADSQQPRDVERDEDGYVPNNLASCSRFKAGLSIEHFFIQKNTSF